MRNKVRQAFTLVEILIVVVILGILAAIVIPQFTNATQDAQAGNLKAQLQSLQNQIELYRARNNGTDPFAGGADWNELLGDSNDDGTYPDTGAEVYIKKAPVNPAHPTAAQRSTITRAAAVATGHATTGWYYCTANHTLFASYFNETTGRVSTTATD